MNFEFLWYFKGCKRWIIQCSGILCANWEIGHFHLLEFKFERLLKRARRELLVHYSKCATSQRQELKEWKGNGISMKWDFLKEYSIVWGLEKLAKVDTQFNRVKLIVRSWIAVSHVSEQAFPVLCSSSNFGKG